MIPLDFFTQKKMISLDFIKIFAKSIIFYYKKSIKSITHLKPIKHPKLNNP